MTVIADLRRLLALPGFRKLFAVRLISQCADGMFQVGLATLLFFSPESMGTAPEIATGFVVMLAPFTVVGPFAGVLLDRWRRRQVLLWGNVIRAFVTIAMATALWLLGGNNVVQMLGLLALSINRFLLAGLSAGLPNVLNTENDDGADLLLTANSLVPTIGAGAAFVGGGIGFLFASVIPVGQFQDSAVLFAAATTMLLAALATARLRRGELGPTSPVTTNIRQDIAAVTADLRAGAKYLAARVTPGQALLVTALHRFLYGLVFIAAILLSRNILASPGDTAAGLGNFAIIMGLIGAGGAIAVVITPTLSRPLASQTWVALMFGLATVSQIVLAISATRLVVFAAALLLGIAAQASKIAIDTIVQRDTSDAFRGRAFAFYDVVFNAAFVAAAILAAFLVPDSGWSRVLFLGIAFAYVILALWMWGRAARTPAEV
ncbi:MAG: MFS transporter [Cellulomonadaceae bacterium]|nr:MFS transporter [Cellulomonadaceae bacterium]